MPYKHVYVEPETLIQHNGVKVIYAYKQEDADLPLSFHYAWQQEGQDEDDATTFDVRQLPGYSPDMETGNEYCRGHHAELIRRLIDAGTFPKPLITGDSAVIHARPDEAGR